MSKVFISYRRNSWGFTHRLANELRERLDTEVFVDVDSIDQTDFEKAIVNHLRQSDVVLLVVSETTFIDRIHRDDDWVRREIREALTLGVPLVMVFVDGLKPPSGLPDDIKDLARMQGVNFYAEFFAPAVERLTDFVVRVSSVQRKGNAVILPTILQSREDLSIKNVPKQSISSSSIKNALSLELMPKPFGWVSIPGKIGKSWKGPPFAIAKYPITNSQFRLFIEGGGYQEEKWWTEAGWAAREKESWLEPRFWRKVELNGIEQPVVGVSWYEAVAFCLWLSDASGEQIMLPTEEQWQYAAQGDDKRGFPWGNLWDGANCNNSVSPYVNEKTTPVRQYEGKGNSPFNVVDMVGNIWEWCLTTSETHSNELDGINDRVVRGGSWGNKNSNWFRCDFSQGVKPRVAFDVRGFRIVRL